MESIPLGTHKCGLYKQVVFIYSWSLEQVSLYIDYRVFIFRTICFAFLNTKDLAIGNLFKK